MTAYLVCGRSMTPSICLDDVVLVKRPCTSPRVGDVVVVEGDGADVVHRLLWVGSRAVVHMGDGSFHAAVVPLERIAGRVVALHRPNPGRGPGEVLPVPGPPPARGSRTVAMLSTGAALLEHHAWRLIRIRLLRRLLSRPRQALWRALGLAYCVAGAEAPAGGKSAPAVLRKSTAEAWPVEGLSRTGPRQPPS
jgi:hypothetical protein